MLYLVNSTESEGGFVWDGMLAMVVGEVNVQRLAVRQMEGHSHVLKAGFTGREN